MLPTYRADHYHTHDELTDWLTALCEALPALFTMESIGASPQGRPIWVVTAADRAHGAPSDRPAYWIDGNTHASELMGSAAALYTLDYLARHHDAPAIAELLRERTLYIAPRINPDGAEHVLQTGHALRSAPRLWPEPDQAPGFIPGDVDGDGETLQMRVAAADGAWKVSKRDPRLLIPRAPWDAQGTFYHLYTEGHFDPTVWADGVLPGGESGYGLDFNRNYPARWEPEHQQRGAGAYPLSEPETRAVVDFFQTHRNIGGALSYHTFSGVLLRPFSDRPDDQMPALDRATFGRLGARCEELTGFPCKSTYHDFCYDRAKLTRGVFDDWAYEDYGVHAYTMELWSPWKQAGLDFSDDMLRFFFRRTEEDDLAMLDWNDRALGGRMFAPWRAVEHPQLGVVEVGGWRWLHSWRNAPPELLASECHPACLFSLDHARALPSPQLTVRAEPLGADLWRVTATCRNTGYLPTYITAMADQHGLARALHLEVTPAGGAQLIEGRAHQRIGHLSGHANITGPAPSSFFAQGSPRAHEARHAWIVRGPGALTVRWWGDRIGALEATARLS
jgi:murein tripeptide amidase MpaA